MARQKFGEYVLDLRGLGEFTYTDEMDITNFLSVEQKELLSSNLLHGKNISVILSIFNIDIEDSLSVGSVGGCKLKVIEYREQSITFFKDILVDDNNDSRYKVYMYIYNSNGAFNFVVEPTPIEP